MILWAYMGTSGLSSYSDAADAATRGPADAARTHREFAHDLANRVAREVPDLVVEGLQSSRLQAAPGTLVRLSAVVVNQGTSTGYEPETAVVVQGIAERLLVVGRRAVVGTVSGIKRPGSRVDLFRASLVAGIVPPTGRAFRPRWARR